MPQRNSTTESLISIISIIFSFILGGTGLAILYNSKGDIITIVSGFTLIGVGIAIIYKVIQNG